MEIEGERKAGRDLKVERKPSVEIDIVILPTDPFVIIGNGAALVRGPQP